CAPVAVALAAGLHCSRIDGSPLRYNNPEPYLPDLLICRPELAAAVLEAVARAAPPRDRGAMDHAAVRHRAGDDVARGPPAPVVGEGVAALAAPGAPPSR